MKVTVENNVKQYILDKINKVYIGFNDNTEVKLDAIEEFYIDLSNDYSTIELTNVFEDIEIINHFNSIKPTSIIYVHIEAIGWFFKDGTGNECCGVYYDIPCDMKIGKLRIDGAEHNMSIELEGIVK